jgi:UDP-4-amino-4-deoxy-L-arabinose-oxoglutarate aminotransferase
MIGQGERTAALERRIAGWFGGVDGAVGAASGSAAIVLALRALQVSKGDEVIVPTYVCRSVAEAVHTVGATPRFCDSGPSWVISVDQVRRAISPRTKAVVVPHLYGIYADTAALKAIGVPVIEDFAQAFPGEGTRDLEGDIGLVSFHPTKCLTAAEGGMAFARDKCFIDRMRALRDGVADRLVGRQFAPLSDLSAALAAAQLDRYAEFLRKRDAIAKLYAETLTAAGRPLPLSPEEFQTSMHFRFTLWLPGGLESVEKPFADAGITVRRGVDELLHRLAGESDEAYPSAVRHYEETVSLPIHPSMTMEEARHVAVTGTAILQRSIR